MGVVKVFCVTLYKRKIMRNKLLSKITFNPEQCGGKPCIRGMRIRVTDVLDLLANGLTHQDILAEMPDLEADDIKACLVFASLKINHPVLTAMAA